MINKIRFEAWLLKLLINIFNYRELQCHLPFQRALKIANNSHVSFIITPSSWKTFSSPLDWIHSTKFTLKMRAIQIEISFLHWMMNITRFVSPRGRNLSPCKYRRLLTQHSMERKWQKYTFESYRMSKRNKWMKGSREG